MVQNFSNIERLSSKNLSNFTATALFKFQKFWTHNMKVLVKDKKILARVTIEVSNCDICTEQKISLINEMKWYKICPIPKG
jgi:hypothetical protein